MTWYQCSFCEESFSTDEKRLDHEKVCLRNGKTEKERFDEKMKAKKQK